MPGNFNENASWLPKVGESLSEIEKQEDIGISVENVKTAIRKMRLPTEKRLVLTVFRGIGSGGF